MKTIKKTEIYNASRAQVFRSIDNLAITGTHITTSSSMMIGSKLNLEFLTKNHSGLGSKCRWTGKMMGMLIDVAVEETKWVPGVEKIWETIGETKLIIYSWYRIQLLITDIPEGISQAELSITYKKPGRLFYKILSFFFADWYCKWCLNKMLAEAKKAIELNKIKSISKYSLYEIN